MSKKSTITMGFTFFYMTVYININNINQRWLIILAWQLISLRRAFRRKERPARTLLCCKMAIITLLKTSITASPSADAVAFPALTIT